MKRLLLIVLTTSLLALGACGSDDPIGKPSDVRNDTTGKWKKATTSENIDIKEHAFTYAEKHMEDGDVHFIIDFHKKNTYQLNLLGGILYLDIHEYVDKEEHDADTIGSGMLLGEYMLYPTGEIEEIK